MALSPSFANVSPVATPSGYAGMFVFESNHPLVGKRIVDKSPDDTSVLKASIQSTLHPCVIVKSDDIISGNVKGKWLIVTDNNNVILRVRKF